MAQESQEKQQPPPPPLPLDPCVALKIKINDDGTITRNGILPVVPATGESDASGQNVVTKDLPLNKENETWVRIYRPAKLPSNDNNVARLPVLVYFHAGAFMMYTADTVLDNEPCCRFCSELLTIVVSVTFRNAPEHRLPAAYEDGAETFLWLKKQMTDPDGEPWLKDYADFSRCYSLGSSTGATIAYYAGLRTLDMDIGPVKLAGIIMNQPFFGGKRLARSEKKLVNDTVMPRNIIEFIWSMALPEGADLDHEYCNPLGKAAQSEKLRSLPRCLVRGFDGDPMLDRQMEFVKMLIKRGVQVTAHFSEFGFHLVDYIDPKRHLAMLGYMRDFII